MKTRHRWSIARGPVGRGPVVDRPVVRRLAVGPFVGVLLVSAAALAACAPVPTGADVPAPPSPARSAIATPAASGASAVAAAPPAPAQVLDGNCSALFPDDLVSAALGTAVVARERFLDSPITHAVPTLGGLDCEWAADGADGAEGNDGAVNDASVRAVVLSSAVQGSAVLGGTVPGSASLSNPVPAAVTEDVSCFTGAVTATSDDASACRFTASAGELWLSGVAYAPAGTAEGDIRTAVASLSDAFRALPAGDVVAPAVPETTVPETTVPETTVPETTVADTAWAPPDCGDLSAAARVAETLRSPDLVGNHVDTTGGSDWAEGIRAAQAGAEVFACAWYHSGPAPAGQLDGFSIQGLPGGAWAQTRVLALPGARVVNVAGADLAVRVPTAVGHDMLDVFDDGNWLQISRADDLEPILSVVPGLLDALNSGSGG